MNSHTVTTVLDAPKTQVFDYLSRVENLPSWASEFARELKFEDGRAKVVNGLGEFYFSIDADEETGVIDMYAGPTEDELGVFPTRVVSLPDGRSAYSFTMFQAPGMPDELFESQYRSLLREFENIRRELAGAEPGAAATTSAFCSPRRCSAGTSSSAWPSRAPASPRCGRHTGRCCCRCSRRTGCRWASSRAAPG